MEGSTHVSRRSFLDLLSEGSVYEARRRVESGEVLDEAEGVEAVAARTAARRARGAATLLDQIGDETGWECVHDSDGLRVRFRKSTVAATRCGSSTTSAYGVKLTADFDAPMFALLASAREFDLIAQWNRYVVRSDIIEVPDRMSVSVFQQIWAPYPFAHRSMAFTAYGADLLDEENECMLVVCDAAASADPEASEEEGAAFDAAVAERASDDAVRSWWRGCGIEMRPLPATPTSATSANSATRTRATMMMIIDPQMGWVPSWLISLMLTVGSPWVFRQINGILSEIGKQCGAAWAAEAGGTKEEEEEEVEGPRRRGWAAVATLYVDRIRANRALYGQVERRCDAFVQRKAAEEAKVSHK